MNTCKVITTTGMGGFTKRHCSTHDQEALVNDQRCLHGQLEDIEDRLATIQRNLAQLASRWP